jgi:hypothetical protein
MWVPHNNFAGKIKHFEHFFKRQIVIFARTSFLAVLNKTFSAKNLAIFCVKILVFRKSWDVTNQTLSGRELPAQGKFG